MSATHARVLVLSSDPAFTHPVCAVLGELKIGTVVCLTIEEFCERKGSGEFTAIATNAFGFGPDWNGATLVTIRDSEIPVIMVTSDSNRLARHLTELGFKGTVHFCQFPREITNVLEQIARDEPAGITA